MTVAELLARISSAELSEWQAYAQVRQEAERAAAEAERRKQPRGGG